MPAEPLLSRYLHEKSAALGVPCAGTFELTPRCNFDCRMCYVHLTAEEQQRRGRELSADEWCSVGEMACKEGLIFLLLTGGEPTLRPDFVEILRRLKRMGLLISVNSNGYLIGEELLRQIVLDPPQRFNISLYGVDNETYESLCGVAAYDRVLQNVRRLREAGVSVRLNLTLTPENVHSREKIYAAARELGIHVQTASYLFPPVRVTGRTEFPQRLPPETAGRLRGERMRASMSETEYLRMRTELSAPPEAEEACAYCRSGRSAFWLTWDGKLQPCGMLPEPAVDVRSAGFDAAWQTIRAFMKTLQYPEPCRRCRYRGLCNICLAQCYCETLRFDRVPEYPCRMTGAMLEALEIPCQTAFPPEQAATHLED